MSSSLRRPIFLAVSSLALVWASSSALAAAPSQQALTTDKDKTSYAIGMQIGTSIARSLESVKGEVDVNVVLRAVDTVVHGGKPQMSIADAESQLKAFGTRMQARQQAQTKALSEKNGSEGAAFLAANAKKPGVKTTASGLQYMVERLGKGARPKDGQSVKVNYTGSLLDGHVFDASAQHGGAAVMKLGEVIPGWTEGLKLMPVGSKYVFWIPAKLAYGERGTPGGPIGPNATLKFEVELLSIGAK